MALRERRNQLGPKRQVRARDYNACNGDPLFVSTRQRPEIVPYAVNGPNPPQCRDGMQVALTFLQLRGCLFRGRALHALAEVDFHSQMRFYSFAVQYCGLIHPLAYRVHRGLPEYLLAADHLDLFHLAIRADDAFQDHVALHMSIARGEWIARIGARNQLCRLRISSDTHSSGWAAGQRRA